MWLEDHGITTLCHAVSSPTHTCPAERTVQYRRQHFIELQSAMQSAYTRARLCHHKLVCKMHHAWTLGSSKYACYFNCSLLMVRTLPSHL